MPYVLVHVIDAEGTIIRCHGPPDVLALLLDAGAAEPHPEHSDAVSIDGTTTSVRVVLNVLETADWIFESAAGSDIQTYVFSKPAGASIVPTERAPGEEAQ